MQTFYVAGYDKKYIITQDLNEASKLISGRRCTIFKIFLNRFEAEKYLEKLNHSIDRISKQFPSKSNIDNSRLRFNIITDKSDDKQK